MAGADAGGALPMRRVAILGGGGAMGGLFGGWLAAKAGAEVTLIDVAPAAIEAIRRDGLTIEEKDGAALSVPLAATDDPASVGPVDLIVTFVKCYHTEAAVAAARPMLGPATPVLTLQNGWGNADRIAAVVGPERVVVGLTYHSGTLVGPGRVRHPGAGRTVVGELDGAASQRVAAIAALLRAGGFETETSGRIRDEIWKKLALNCCTLPTSALLRFEAHRLVAHRGTLALMRGVLDEAVAVAAAQGIALDVRERWPAITGLLKRAVGAKASMLQDVEAGRRTEIEVVNGAVAAAGRAHGVPTPLNDAMVWLVTALQESYLGGRFDP
jgi:2-dehydropantoate 2-reductase